MTAPSARAVGLLLVTPGPVIWPPNADTLDVPTIGFAVDDQPPDAVAFISGSGCVVGYPEVWPVIRRFRNVPSAEVSAPTTRA